MYTRSMGARPAVNWGGRSLRWLLVAALLLTLLAFALVAPLHTAAVRADGLGSAGQVMLADGQPARLGVNWTSGGGRLR